MNIERHSWIYVIATCITLGNSSNSYLPVFGNICFLMVICVVLVCFHHAFEGITFAYRFCLLIYICFSGDNIKSCETISYKYCIKTFDSMRSLLYFQTEECFHNHVFGKTYCLFLGGKTILFWKMTHFNHFTICSQKSIYSYRNLISFSYIIVIFCTRKVDVTFLKYSCKGTSNG